MNKRSAGSMRVPNRSGDLCVLERVNFLAMKWEDRGGSRPRLPVPPLSPCGCGVTLSWPVWASPDTPQGLIWTVLGCQRLSLQCV